MKIALTKTENPQKHQFYIDWLASLSDVQVTTLSHMKGNLDELGACDGLVLSGGKDIHPKFYGGSLLNYRGAPAKFDAARDEFELNAFGIANEQQIPVLGICRGLQLINVACGGSLLQDLGSGAKETTHKGNPDSVHQIRIQEGTLLRAIVASEEGKINSAHHQAIDRVADELMVNCRAEDGTIEGVEWKEKKGKPFLLGLQWHPERMFSFKLENSPFSAKIGTRFIEEAKSRQSGYAYR